MGLFRRIYSGWVIFSLAVFFAICIIPQILCIPFQRAHNLALRINYLWGWGFFRLAMLPIRIDRRSKLDRKQQYILCANHFSYLDIPALGLFEMPFKFVGKSQLAKIPLFGLMYKHIHITVNRSSYRSRAQSLEKARRELKKGFNLGFFPEGGIRLKEFPTMVRFQDGAFRLSAENNVPIIPITFLDNYHILPDDAVFEVNRIPCRIVYHEPIWPESATEEGIRKLKDQVHRVIQNELNADYTSVAHTPVVVLNQN